MLAQTFTIDKNVVNFAEQVNITSVDVYFKKKPLKIGNKSGGLEPGVSIFLVPTSAEGVPNFKTLDDYTVARKEFSEIVSSIDSNTVTKFNFLTPVPVRTGIEYAFIVKYDNEEEFELWASTRGEINIETQTASPGIAGKYVGRFFQLSTEKNTWQALPYKSLKFKVNVGRYAFSGVIPDDVQPSFTLHMKNYEFVTYNTSLSVGTFSGGEYVFKDKETADGTCAVVAGNTTVVATGTGFSGLFTNQGSANPSYIVVKNGDKNDVRLVVSTDNSNTIVVDRPFSFTNAGAAFIRSPVAKAYFNKNSRYVNGSDNFIVLSDSSANSTVRFTNNSILIGEVSRAIIANSYFNDILVHSSDSHVYTHTPAGTNYTVNQIFKYTSTDNLNGIVSSDMSFPIEMYQPENLDVNQPVMLKSRSNEVALQNWQANVYNLSSKLTYSIITTNDYSTPQIDYNATDVFFTRYLINNDYTNEHTKYGSAYSKHITKKITFANGRQAEDALVYLHAYKPAGTDLKVYVKLFNSQDSDYFDDKDWTLLRETSGNRTSSLTNLSDFVEYTYGLYDYSDPAFNVATNWSSTTTSGGSITVTGGSETITGSGTDFSTDLNSGDLIKIYPSLFPEKYVIASVYSVTGATSLILNTPITSTEATYLGSYGLSVQKLDLKHQAFINKTNNNTVRYFNSNMTLFDKYDTFAIKIVFLSNSQFIIPKIANVRAVGVSA